jgi:hypothetical protein
MMGKSIQIPFMFQSPPTSFLDIFIEININHHLNQYQSSFTSRRLGGSGTSAPISKGGRQNGVPREEVPASAGILLIKNADCDLETHHFLIDHHDIM